MAEFGLSKRREKEKRRQRRGGRREERWLKDEEREASQKKGVRGCGSIQDGSGSCMGRQWGGNGEAWYLLGGRLRAAQPVSVFWRAGQGSTGQAAGNLVCWDCWVCVCLQPGCVGGPGVAATVQRRATQTRPVSDSKKREEKKTGGPVVAPVGTEKGTFRLGWASSEQRERESCLGQK